ncbi:histidine kinase dimerization/phospho-acceptor domain-containing protein, partial [Falsiroseomonas oryzae]|uniref:histidine kinase dimerization/phospho-acceptor domain-containing protein n=1 Tax=Falsiroseomonas oryzae TaxID=2766473 RepID=UPI0022EA816A
MPEKPSETGPLAPSDLVLLRHDRLRRTAPAVQHEVNNALMVLASNLELLGRSAAEGAPRRQLDRAMEAMRRLDQTVRGFLDAARREAEDPAAVSPAAAVAQVLPLLRVALGGRFGFELEPADGVWTARLDRGRLDLALLSLARDAAA